MAGICDDDVAVFPDVETGFVIQVTQLSIRVVGPSSISSREQPFRV